MTSHTTIWTGPMALICWYVKWALHGRNDNIRMLKILEKNEWQLPVGNIMPMTNTVGQLYIEL